MPEVVDLLPPHFAAALNLQMAEGKPGARQEEAEGVAVPVALPGRSGEP